MFFFTTLFFFSTLFSTFFTLRLFFLDSKNASVPNILLVVCNGKVFGHGLTINPYASINDGKLSVTFLGRVSFLDYIRNLGKLKRGELIKHPEVRYFETENLSIHMDENVIYIEADGELIGSGSFEFSVVKGMLRIVS